jgi:hypothetical protein
MAIIILIGIFFWGCGLFTTLLALQNKKMKDKIMAIIFWIGFVYIIAVALTPTRNPGCVEWHSVGSNPQTVTDGEHLVGRVWKESTHLEWDIDYVPVDCDCVTYHWLFVAGDWNDFTKDSVIKGQFQGPTVKPNKLNLEYYE